MKHGRPRALFICGSINQTTQMHKISLVLPEVDAWFTPYYGDWYVELGRRLGLSSYTIGGNKLRARCLSYLNEHRLPVDLCGRTGGYDLVLTCTDVVVPSNTRSQPLILVQEGIMDPVGPFARTIKSLRAPRWIAGTALTGLSLAYDRFCVASHGYREHFAALGVPRDRMRVTGIPNFDDCDQYRNNDFPHRGYALVCTSDMRETFKCDDRRAFIERAVQLANGRQVIFKLHPNERIERATREIAQWAPDALVLTTGSAEQMVANCDVLITQYSSLSLVGMALGKEVHSYFTQDELRSLMPIQNKRAAEEIADVCRDVMTLPRRQPSRTQQAQPRQAGATA